MGGVGRGGGDLEGEHAMARRWLARRLSVVIAIVTLAAALFPHSAALAVGTLDQDQSQSCGGTAGVQVVQGRPFAQTFTAGLSGNLDQIDLLGRDGHSTPFPLRVDVRALVDGAPTGATLGSGSVASLGVSAGWTSVALDPAAQVTAGKQYAIVLSSDTVSFEQHEKTRGEGEGPFGAYHVMFSTTDVYTGGNHWDGSPEWSPWLAEDLAFRTYVSPADPSTAVADAMASLSLEAEHEDVLVAFLAAADAYVADGETADAVDKLDDLIDKIGDYAENGTITQAAGDELIALVEAYRSHIEAA